MKPLHETTSRESAISTAKAQIRRKRQFSTLEDTAPDSRNPPDAKSSPVPPENKLPRTVPAHVQRRANVNTRALTPPRTTTKSKSGHKAKPDKRKSKKVNHFGDNSDGDSEDDQRKQRHTDDGDTPVSRRKVVGRVPDVGPSGHNSSTSSFLTLEEQRRLKVRVELQAAEEKWKIFELERKECTLRKPNRKSLLAKEKLQRCGRIDTSNTKQRQMWGLIWQQCHQLEDFYDECLFSHIEQQLDRDTKNEEHMPSRSAAYIDDVLRNVEGKIIFRCQAFDPYDPHRNLSVMPPNQKNRLVGIFDRMQTSLMEKIMATCNSEKDIKKEVLAFISKNSSGIWEAFAERKDDVLVNQYLSALSERLVEVLTRDIDFALLGTSVSKHVASPLATASSSDVSALRRVNWEEFIDQAKAALDSETLREQSECWYLELREKLLREFRADLRHVRVRLEFVENLDQSGGVSLVIFKGDMLTSIQNVSPEKLEWLGWKRDSPTKSYWHYTIDGEEVFKVQMNGEVIGIWTANGDITWD